MYLTLSCDFVGVKGQPFRKQAIWTAGVLRAEQKRHKQGRERVWRDHSK